MFLGTHERSVDTKGRVVLPAEHREELGESGFVTKAIDRCLVVFSPEQFQEVMAQMEIYARKGSKQRRQASALTAGAQRVVPDKQGRIQISADLLTYGGLVGNEALVIGANTRIEIWNPQRWREDHPEAHAEVFDLADADLASLGI